MITFLKWMFLGLACTTMVVQAQAKRSVTYTIAVDISSSVSITHDQNEADNAASFIRNQLKSLRIGDIANLRVFGEYGVNRNFKYHAPVTRKVYPNKVKNEIGLLLRSIPNYLKVGTLKLNKSTNIIGFIQDNHPHFNCSSGGIVYLISDAIESSEFANLNSLSKGTAKPPRAPDLSGCTFYMLGTGHGHSNSSVKFNQNLNLYWKRYFESAGARFISLSQF